MQGVELYMCSSVQDVVDDAENGDSLAGSDFTRCMLAKEPSKLVIFLLMCSSK